MLGKQHGEGEYTNGQTKLRGLWEKGKRVKWLEDRRQLFN